jgi:uncharacterized membrane protein YfcA
VLFDPVTLFFLAVIVVCAYSVFGITGFGAAMVAVPISSHFVPLTVIVPVILLTDLVATLTVGLKNWRKLNIIELLRIAPLMLVGIALGVLALQEFSASFMLFALGIFVVLHSAWGLYKKDTPDTAISSNWAYVAGTLGGIFGAAFGTGGPIYTIYLMRRISDAEVLRTTMAVVIFISGILRLVVFGVFGVYANDDLYMLALILVPFCLLGVLIGSKLRYKISHQSLRKLMLQLLLIGGISVIFRSQMI